MPDAKLRPAARFILVRFYGVGRCVQVGRRFHSICRGISPLLTQELWLAVDEIVHHDDVMPAIIVRPSKAASPIEEIRTQARLEAVVCAMCWAVPVDERICYLFRCVCEFGTVVPFKLVVLKSRAEQPFHFRLVAPLERARHAGRWWDILIGTLNIRPTPPSRVHAWIAIRPSLLVTRATSFAAFC